jgi:hypothetical protein
LRAVNQPLALVKPIGLDAIEDFPDVVAETAEHAPPPEAAEI